MKKALVLLSILSYFWIQSAVWPLSSQPAITKRGFTRVKPFFLEQSLLVFDEIYDPDYLSSLLIQLGVRPRQNSDVLDVGTGTGVVGILALQRGAARAVLVDINPKAVENARKNVAAISVAPKTEVIEGDLFPPVLQGRKFSHIYCNLPSPFADGTDIAVFDTAGRILKRLLEEAARYLEENGTLEITVNEKPEVLEMIYRIGWEPLLIEGTRCTRTFLNTQGADSFVPDDYVRMTLVGQTQERKKELKDVYSNWRRLAEITDAMWIPHYFKEEESEQLVPFEEYKPLRQELIEFIKTMGKKKKNFSWELLAKSAYDLIRIGDYYHAGSNMPQYAVPWIRMNEVYSNYISLSLGEISSEGEEKLVDALLSSTSSKSSIRGNSAQVLRSI